MMRIYIFIFYILYSINFLQKKKDQERRAEKTEKNNVVRYMSEESGE